MGTETNGVGAARDATWLERCTWGKCPICGALPGVGCQVVEGPQEMTINGRRRVLSAAWAHTTRLMNAPTRVKLMAVE